MNQYEFVIALVAIVFIFSIVRHRMGIRPRSMRELRGHSTDSAEADRLRNEVGELKERIKVLERITVEKENSLAKEIESLRDR
jgi:hypothetical protein